MSQKSQPFRVIINIKIGRQQLFQTVYTLEFYPHEACHCPQDLFHHLVYGNQVVHASEELGSNCDPHAEPGCLLTCIQVMVTPEYAAHTP